jgi:hypothetical protein
VDGGWDPGFDASEGFLRKNFLDDGYRIYNGYMLYLRGKVDEITGGSNNIEIVLVGVLGSVYVGFVAAFISKSFFLGYG